MMKDQPILHVEDNDDDAELTLMAFAKARIPNPVVRARDGVDALDYLFGGSGGTRTSAHQLPALILLDLMLPRVGGLEVLAAIRANECTRHLPIVIFTSSNEEQDRLAAYHQFANSYIRKPIQFDQFATATRQLGLYWLSLNQPMPRTSHPVDF
jgi:two-component system response regulator